MSRAARNNESVKALQRLGISEADAIALRRISMTLHRWHERECGDDGGCIERDEESGKAYWRSSWSGKRYPIADKEAGALKRLASIMERYPLLSPFVQGDPRGCALYILRPGDVPQGQSADAYYSRGIAVYR